jgi:Uncharacterized protein, similar to the N-terminal domain of Lon protease
MTTSSELELLLPLFPLPNVVFFPSTRMPLHVFEPRYRNMIGDVLAGDERFGIVLLKPGWETNYYGTPTIHDIGTIGTIEQTVTLEDGRFNILVRGDMRFRVVEEVRESPYRVARVVAYPEVDCSPSEAFVQRQWLIDLSQRYLEFLPEQGQIAELETASLDAITNALIMSLNLDVEEKQQLLQIDSIGIRSEKIANELARRITSMEFLAPFRRGGDPRAN